jgi:hypothetical protein
MVRGGEACLARIDDELRAARDRGGGARRMGEAGDRRVVSQNKMQPAFSRSGR